MSDMKYYLTKCKAPDYAFSPDAYFPAIHAEKTILGGKYETTIKKETVVKKIFGGTRTNVVPSSATAIVSKIGSFANDPDITVKDNGDMYEITATGIPTHASTPQDGKSAFMVLFKYLSRILPENDAYKEIAAQLFTAFNATDGSGVGINCYGEATGALTLNLGVMSGDSKKFECDFDSRHPVTVDDEIAHNKLISALEGFKLVSYKCSKGLYWPKDHPLVSTLQNVYQDVTGEKAEPLTMGGGTYARTLPCAVAFGPAFPGGKSKGAHMAEECSSISELMRGARIYAHALYELATM